LGNWNRRSIQLGEIVPLALFAKLVPITLFPPNDRLYRFSAVWTRLRSEKKFLRIFMPLPDSAGGAFFRKNRALENSGKTRCRELQKFIRILLDFLHGNPENGKNCGRKRIAFRKKS
jgi:hypothetical protein